MKPAADTIEDQHQPRDVILCSVLITVYNHEAYIRQCLDSCLEQKTDFRYQILVGEDDSDDRSREICKEYAEHYPDKIRLFLNSRENVIYINGRATGRWNLLNLMVHTRSKYMALLSGDDYWTDPGKLQKQVDFLERNPDYTICHCRSSLLIHTDTGDIIEDLPAHGKSVSTIHDLLTGNHILTSSVMYRREAVRSWPVWLKMAPMLDWPLNLMYAAQGKIKRINKRSMTVYRLHSGGIWTGLHQYRRSLEYLEFCTFLKEHWLPPGLHPYLEQNIYHIHYRIAYSCFQFDTAMYWEHFRYCLMHAGISVKRWRCVVVLLLLYCGILTFDGRHIRFRFFS